jgi:hypothetical protein
VLALAVSGRDYHARGFFTTAGASAAPSIAKWKEQLGSLGEGWTIWCLNWRCRAETDVCGVFYDGGRYRGL